MEEPATDDPAGAREVGRFPASLAFGVASGLGNLTTREECPAGVAVEFEEAKGEAAVGEFFPGKATAAAAFTWKAGCTFFPPKVGIMARMI